MPNTILLLLASQVAVADVDPENGNLRVGFPLRKPGFVHGVPNFLDFRSFLACRRLVSKGDVFEFGVGIIKCDRAMMLSTFEELLRVKKPERAIEGRILGCHGTAVVRLWFGYPEWTSSRCGCPSPVRQSFAPS